MNIKKFPIILSFVSLLMGGLHGQNFVNGSFETTSAPMACNYNLANATFNTYMSSTNAYGPGQELDILIAGCYQPSIPHGNRAVGVAASPSDEFAMNLTAPLTIGNSYTFTFWAYSELTFRPQGNIQIGASTNNTSFGTLLFTGVTVPWTWTQFTVNFTATAAFTHITVRNEPGAIYWNHVDNFVMGSPLPVELAQFDVRLLDNRVKLDWSTYSETNNAYYTIERSTDGIHFEELSRVEGAGNSNGFLSYESYDNQPFIGTNYYRLRQTDYDGGFKFSEIRTIQVNHLQAQIFPNPANGVLNIRLDAPEQALIRFVNANGQLMKEFIWQQQMIDVSDIPAGMYYVHIITNEKSSTEKLIIK